jgi:hypothetical protein
MPRLELNERDGERREQDLDRLVVAFWSAAKNAVGGDLGANACTAEVYAASQCRPDVTVIQRKTDILRQRIKRLGQTVRTRMFT